MFYILYWFWNKSYNCNLFDTDIAFAFFDFIAKYLYMMILNMILRPKKHLHLSNVDHFWVWTICFAYFPTIFHVQQDLWKNRNILRSFRLMFNLSAVVWCKVKKYISGGAFCQVTLIKLLRVHVTFLFRPQQLHNFPNLAMSANGRKFPQSSN